jgi:DNA-binding NtrC family response regulator
LARRGDFREDLYYRLNVIRIDVPPLRERKDEIPLLCQHFFQKYSGKYNSRIKFIPEDLMELFLQYDWPGNIRELENILKRYLILADKEAIRREILSKVERLQVPQEPELVPVAASGPPIQSHASVTSANPKEINLKEKVKAATMEAERHVIGQALRTTNYNRKKAAAMLKISYKALLYKMKQYNL